MSERSEQEQRGRGNHRKAGWSRGGRTFQRAQVWKNLVGTFRASKLLIRGAFKQKLGVLRRRLLGTWIRGLGEAVSMAVLRGMHEKSSIPDEGCRGIASRPMPAPLSTPARHLTLSQANTSKAGNGIRTNKAFNHKPL